MKKERNRIMSKKIKKPSWWEEFKTFAVKGNAMALAVGTIIGGAFGTITKSLTNDIKSQQNLYDARDGRCSYRRSCGKG